MRQDVYSTYFNSDMDIVHAMDIDQYYFMTHLLLL